MQFHSITTIVANCAIVARTTIPTNTTHVTANTIENVIANTALITIIANASIAAIVDITSIATVLANNSILPSSAKPHCHHCSQHIGNKAI